MSFRVTPNVSLAHSLAAQRRHAAQTAALQEQITSGLRINRPSDDPFGLRTLLSAGREVDRLDADLANISATRNTLSHSFTHLQDSGLLFVRAKEIALSAQQSAVPQDLQTLATEVDRLIDRLVTIANAEHDGEFLFGGTRTDVQPFVKQTASGNSTIDGISYLGSQSRVETVVGRNLNVDRIFSGAEIFQQTAREATLVIGGSGAAPGAGTDTAVGSSELVVRHTLTTFSGASGVQAGASSPAGDTIIGPSGAYTLTINDTSGTGAFGTVSLNGGPEFPFTSSDADLRVDGPFGEVIYVDTTGITPGFSGTVDIQADGTLSIDGGLTETAIDFSTNQVLTHSVDQTITHIDSSGIRRAGVDTVEYGGTSGAFQTLIDLRDLLRDPAAGESPEWHDALSRRLGDIERVHDHLLGIVGEQSVTLEQLDALEQRAESLQLEGERVASETGGTDYGEAALKLQQAQTLLELTLASSARLFDQSILDFLR